VHNQAVIFCSGIRAVNIPVSARYARDERLLSPAVPWPLNMLLEMGKMTKIQDLTARCFIKAISFSVDQVMINEFFLIFDGDFHISKIPSLNWAGKEPLDKKPG
jgi:hypothetical protein